MRQTLTVLLLSAAIILAWGLWGFFGKLALNRQMAPLAIYLAEVAVGVAVGCLAVAIFLRMGQALPWQAPLNLYGFLSGVGMAIGLLLFYLALAYGKAVVIVPLTATYPLVTVLLSHVFLGERPTAVQWLGMALVVTGAALLLSGPILASEGSS